MHRVARLLTAGLCLALAAFTASAATWRLRITTSEPGALARQLAAVGFDVTRADGREGTVDLVGDEAVIDRLRALGYDPQPADPAPFSTTALSDYLAPAEVEAKLAQYEASHPGLAKRVAYATDHEGRTAWALKISDNVTQEEDEPAVLFVAQHHAREVMTTEVAIDIIDQLLTHYGSDPVITHWVDSAEIFVIPTHNPDGTDYVFTGNAGWRKNRRNNGDGTFGVDLNRNYPFAWGACGGSSEATGDDTYRGPAAGSEPVTSGYMALARQQRPVFFITYHTYGPYALHPYGCNGVETNPPDFRTLRELTGEVAALMESDTPGIYFEFGTPWEALYSVDGDFDSWMYGEIGSFGLTFELNNGAQGFQPDYATWRESTVQRARTGWRYYLGKLDGPRLTGHVTDACSGLVLPAATIALGEQPFTNGEAPRTPAPGTGRFDWPVTPGTFTLQASASGYLAQSWPVAVGFTPATQELRLAPSGRDAAAPAGVRVADASGDADAQLDPGETVDIFLSAYATGGALTGLAATVTSADPYVSVLDGTASFGALAAGERREAADAVQLAIAAGCPDEHVVVLHVVFTAGQNLCAAASDIGVRVTRGTPAAPFLEVRLDANPHWAIDNGGTSGGWEFGVPLAGIGGAPPAAYTGPNVYATNLAGNYANNAHYTLVAGPYDLTGLRHAELRLARWLVSETGFDIARIEARRNAESAWRPVWSGFGRDTAWVPLRYDVSSVADGADAFSVRFTLTTDGKNGRAGFYLDDLALWGERLPIDGAHLNVASVSVDDADPAYANGNGRLDAGETATLAVSLANHGTATAHAVSAVLDAISPGVTVYQRVADFPDIAASGGATSLAPHFTVSTTAGCGDAVSFRLTMRWDDGGQSVDAFVVPVGETTDTTLLLDDYETDKFWLGGGDAQAGTFVRGDPRGCTNPTLGPIRPEDDTTAAPGRLCWITGNPAPSATCPPTGGNVDKGTTWVRSPRFDASGGGRLLIDYQRWWAATGTNFSGSIQHDVDLSADDGVTWTTISTASNHAPAWTTIGLEATGLVPLTATMRLRFSAKEVLSRGSASTVLAVDDVNIHARRGVCAPFSPTDAHAPNAVGATLRVERAGADVALSWSAPEIDAAHDAARFFPVWRSATAHGGFAAAGEATATAWRDAGAAGGGSWFYIVDARNAAGSSGEAPGPD